MFTNGSKYLRADFHLHTKADKEFKYENPDDRFLSDYVNKLKSENISIGVITNHNKFDYKEYKNLKKKAIQEDILILPGVELSVKEGKNGIHVLIVFEPESWIKKGKEEINSFLDNAFKGIPNRESANTNSNFDLKTMFEELNSFNNDYFIIFAHVEQKSGLFKEINWSIIKNYASKKNFNEKVLGLQKVRTRDNIPLINDSFQNVPAFVEGSDPKNIDEIGKKNKVFIKLSELSYSAVKYALKDKESRVSNEIPQINHGYIKSMNIEGGSLDSKKINFSNSLNTLIGIRGSGKSTIIEFLRYCLGEKSKNDEDYKNRLIENLLGSGGKITLEIVDKNNVEYKLKKIHGEKEIITNINNNDLSISLNSIIENPIYYGQKDLSETESGYQLDLLNKVVGKKVNNYDFDLFEINNKIISLLNDLFTFPNKENRLSDVKQEIQDTEHKLKIYKDEGIDEKLKLQNTYLTDEKKIIRILDKINSFQSEFPNIKDLKNELKDFEGINSEINHDIFDQINFQIQNLKLVFDEYELLESSYSKILSEIKNILKIFQKQLDDKKEDFAKTQRSINIKDLNLNTFLILSTNLEKLKIEKQDIEKDLQNKNNKQENLIKLVDQRNELLLKKFNEYKSEIKKINSIQNELEIFIYFKKDKKNFDSLLSKILSGTRIGKNQEILIKNYSDPVDLILDLLIYNSNKLNSLPKLKDKNEAILEKLVQNINECVGIIPENQVEIKYHGKLLQNHSVGQRASALLLFILMQDENDLIIIDQPEDDLDNKIIYTELIRTIRNKKPNIQFIFATHNANIPVLGDAEKIISTECDSESFSFFEGGIDSKEIQQKIVDIMEGGKEAFDKRNSIYEFWSNKKTAQ